MTRCDAVDLDIAVKPDRLQIRGEHGTAELLLELLAGSLQHLPQIRTGSGSGEGPACKLFARCAVTGRAEKRFHEYQHPRTALGECPFLHVVPDLTLAFEVVEGATEKARGQFEHV